MSLKEAAQYLQSQGRGTDSRLMHVSPQELQSLQTLAMAKGGSLTINPHTGLPEAGFLEDVLPVAAAGAMMAFAPEAAPFIGEGLGLGTGALGTGVGMGLLAGGSQAVGQLLTTGKLDLNSALRTGAISGLTAGAIKGFSGTAPPTSNVKTDVPALNILSQSPTIPGADTSIITTPTVNSGTQPINPASFNNAVTTAEDAAGYAGANNQVAGTSPYNPSPTTAPPAVDKSWWSSLSSGQKLATGLGGVAGLSLLAGANQPKIQTPASTSYIRPYTYAQTRNPNYGQPGQSYYNQSYTAQPIFKAAQGGLMGGPVEQMSQINAGQTNYPQSGLDHATYAVPSQMPTSAEVVNSDYDVNTNPYTGDLKRMAAGGSTDSGYIPTSQAVQDYNKMLSSRAVEEYLNNPMPSAMMPASQRPALAAAPAQAPQTPPIGQDINGLYQYYLGRQPSKDEVGQWASQINGPVTPDMANYFQQFTGGELAKTGYKPTGPNPFLGQAGLPMNGPASSLAGQTGLPQYTYNQATRSYTPVAQQYTPFVQPAVAAPVPDSSSGGGKAGGLMPYNLGGYSDGGRLLKGPGDGMSDNIPASIGDKQPARLADGEFVVPADVVSHLGNGSTDAGAKKLYAMMDKVRTARTGNKKQGKEIKAEKFLKT
jgi:hypothetical protein